MGDAKRFTEDIWKSGGGTGRSGIHGNSERVDTGGFVIGDTERSTKDTRGDSKRSRRHTWTTRRDRRKSGGSTGRSGIQEKHGNIEKEGKKIQEDLTCLMQRNLRKIQGNQEEVQEDLEYTEIQNGEIQEDS
jgi:hypothetical protein